MMTNATTIQQSEQQVSSLARGFRLIQICRTTSINTLGIALNKIIRTHTFALAANSSRNQHENESLIRIDLIHLGQPIADILWFPIELLPSRGAESFTRIQLLLKMIFHRDKTFHAWDFNKQCLNPFVRLEYLSQADIDQINIIDLQDRFKQWYNKTFPHHQNCPAILSVAAESQADDPSCTCSHRPYKNSTDKWNLFHAFYHVFKVRFSLILYWNPINDESSRRRRLLLLLSIYHNTYRTFLKIVIYNWNSTQVTRYQQHLMRNSLIQM